ncbi:MAG TPA: HAD family hydrolase [bacterium]|nr:HAD family hydrolase [bacterium]
MTSPRAIFFDLYGTLIDIRTDEDDPWVYATLAEYLGYWRVSITPAELAREYRARVRTYLERSPERFPEVDVSVVFREIMTHYRRGGPDDGGDGLDTTQTIAVSTLFRTLTRRYFATFPGVHQVLDRLRARYRIGLISDAQWVFTEPELEIAGLSQFFPVRVLSSRIGVKKPSPRPFLQAMHALGVAPEASVYVGDNPPRDLAGARGAGMRCIIFRGENVQHNGLVPDACFQAYAELEAVVEALIGA